MEPELSTVEVDVELLYVMAELVVEEVDFAGEPTEPVELLVELVAAVEEI